MSKTFKKRRNDDYDDDDDYNERKQMSVDRRKKKRINRALKVVDADELIDLYDIRDEVWDR